MTPTMSDREERRSQPPGGGLWWACQYPERPTDPFVTWHYRGCNACRIKADALERQYPDDPHVAWLVSVLGEHGDE